MEINELIGKASFLNGDRSAPPEKSKDLPLFEVLLGALNAIGDRVTIIEDGGGGSGWTVLATIDETLSITADVADSWTTFHTMAAHSVILVVLLIESDGAATAGTIEFKVQGVHNGGAWASPVVASANLALGANIAYSDGQFAVADSGSDLTWSYNVTSFGTGTAEVRLRGKVYLAV